MDFEKLAGRRSNIKRFPQTALFGHILEIKIAHPLYGAWSFLVHVRFTPSHGPKGFKKHILKEIEPWKHYHEV
jgi:hypothetical protein